MVKNSAKFGLIFLVGQMIWQWTFKPEMQWFDILGSSIFAFLFYLLFEWVDKRHEQDKDI